ncbi:MAG TPA: DUF3999 family protein [Isosphaeraceae bacterium]|nr:DUF3999 family protein [Isosphaeraceae bacterium]
MKIHWTVLLGVTLAAAPSMGAGESRFRFSKELDRGAAALEEILAVPLDLDIYAAARDGFPDLRIRDDAGTEVPYVLEQVNEQRTEHVRESCASELVSLVAVPGKGLEIVVRLAEKAPNAGGLTVLTPLADYEHRVKVSGSPNEKDWSPLVSDGLIFDYKRYMDVRNRDIVLPANAFRRFKLEIEQDLDERESPFLELTRGLRGGPKHQGVEIARIERRPFRIDRIDLWRTVEQKSALRARKMSYPVESFQIEEDAKEKVTRIQVLCRREPLTGLILETASRNFNRTARVRVPVTRGVKTEWVEIGNGTIYRLQLREFRREALQLNFPERREQPFQIVIENADNPPLEITSVKADGNRYRMVFLPSVERRYRVEYGSDTAESPQYDTAAVLASLRPGFQPVDARLGAQVENPRYREVRGLGDLLNNAIFLTLAIVLMVVVLGWILFRAGQRIKQLPSEEV